MKKLIQTELKKSICSPLFVLAVLAYLLLLLCTKATVGTENDENLFQMLLHSHDPQWLESHSYAWIKIWSRVIHGNYHCLFLPMLAAFPSVFPFCDEYNSGCFRFSVTRSTRCKWIHAKCVATVITGWLVVLLSVGFVAVVCFVAFPSVNAPFALVSTRYPLPQTTLAILKNMLSECSLLLMLTSANVMMIFVIAACTRNGFAALCLPMVVLFLGSQIAERMTLRDATQLQWYLLDADALVNSWNWFDYLTDGHSALWLLLPMALVCVLWSICFALIMRRRLLS